MRQRAIVETVRGGPTGDARLLLTCESSSDTSKRSPWMDEQVCVSSNILISHSKIHMLMRVLAQS